MDNSVFFPNRLTIPINPVSFVTSHTSTAFTFDMRCILLFSASQRHLACGVAVRYAIPLEWHSVRPGVCALPATVFRDATNQSGSRPPGCSRMHLGRRESGNSPASAVAALAEPDPRVGKANGGQGCSPDLRLIEFGIRRRKGPLQAMIFGWRRWYPVEDVLIVAGAPPILAQPVC